MEDFDFSPLMHEAQREYLNFMDDGEEESVYVEKVKEMIEEKSVRLDVSINDLRRKNPERAKNLLENPFEEIIAFRRALKEFVSIINLAYATLKEEFYVAFSGSFGNKHVSPRFLTSRYLGKMVCLEGIVTTASAVRPKLVRSVHYCPATTQCIERKYADVTSLAAVPSSSVYPTKDHDGNLLEIEYGLSRYIDHQILTVQELPENSPIGTLPCSVNIVCEADLADKCKPGDRVLIVGHYKSLPNKQQRYIDGFFRTVLMANNVIEVNKDMDTAITVEDVRMCKRLAKSKTVNVFDLLSKSLAPSIHGYEYVKKGILCLMFGGVEKILPSETRLRGDINVLLVGDPSVAKSQLLRYVLQTAPRAITTTGRGSSGVGLTAAVTTDPETGDRMLEAGAMVLADRGVVCIDEFDKMSDVDRTAIHEVMEQGKVTITKAGVHASLNARCSVLAAANPVYGRYDPYKTPMENIGLQDSLLSRFDLLFVMLDIADPVQDDTIAEHVLRMHRYRHPQEKDGEVLSSSSGQRLSTKNLDHDENEDIKMTMYEKYDPLLHGGTRRNTDKILSTTFMRKFLRIGRLLKPKLTQQASDILAEEYVRLRSQDYHTTDPDVARTQPVTARTLETLIRLSTAHAKCRMSNQVMKEDAMVAIKLVQFAYFKKVLTKEKRRAPDDDEQPSTSKAKKAKGKKGPEDKDTGTSDNEAEVLVQAAHSREPESSERPSTSSETTIEANRLNLFKLALNEMFRSERANSLPLGRVSNYVNEKYLHAPFTSGEINAAILTMVRDNQVMSADDIIFLI